MSEDLSSPVVNKDRSVTFNLKNEYARTVEVSGDFVFGKELHVLDARTPMEKGSDNVWTLTSVPMLPGTYGYMYVVNGLRTLDPLNPLIRRVAEPFRPRGLRMNIVKIEAGDPMPWDLSDDIPHGKVVIEKFYSERLRRVKGCTFYLPPDYRPTEKYPVLYLLHGAGNDYLSWIFDEATDNIMDYLISKGKARKMIVAMPDGHVGAVGALFTATPAERRKMAEQHEYYFFRDVMPFVESRYQVSSDNRTIAGLSMGGGQTSAIVTARPEMFTAAGIFSSGASDQAKERLPSIKDQLNRLKLLYVSCGNWDTLVLERNKELCSKLDEHGIRYIYMSADAGHVAAFWQRSLVDFASRLSQSM